MAGLKRFQYVGKDYEAIVEDCVRQIKEKHPDKWNDFYEDSTGMMLVELFAYVTDLLLFYLERQGNETFLSTAQERQNLINLCKLIAYQVAGGQCAQTDVEFSHDPPHALDIVLPKGFPLETRGGVLFETQEEAILPAGETVVRVPAIEGETVGEQIGVSDGSALQEFYLSRVGVVQLISLHVGAHEWQAVDSVADKLIDDAVFMVELDAWGRARVAFGDGTSGRIPGKDEKITVRYRLGGGIRGNVAADTITEMRDIVTDVEGNRVTVKVTNPVAAAGGTEPESADRIKVWAPRHYETQNRCVTQGDYEAKAMTFRDPDAGGFAKARAFCRERSGEANVIRYYVLAHSNDSKKVALAPQALKDSFLAYIDKYKMLTNWIEIDDGTWKEVNVKGIVLMANGFDADKLLSDLNERVAALLKMEERAMGDPLRISDLYAVLDGTEGVVHVELTTPTATVAAAKNELLVLGSVELKIETEGAGTSGKNW